MNYIGYINKAQYFEHTTEIINLMKGHGCVNIHIEETKDKKRIEWCKFIDSLSNGDSAVFASFDNVFHNFHDMMFFTLDLICKVFSKRDRASHDDLEAELYSYSFEDRKLKRYKLVINMYKAGYSVKEIMERTGYRGKSNIYRILHQYDIEMEYPSMSRTANKVREKSI